MDRQRFDAVARAVGRRTTRRGALRLLGAALLGHVPARLTPAAAQQATCEVDADCTEPCRWCRGGVCEPIMNYHGCAMEDIPGCEDGSCTGGNYQCLYPYCQNGQCKLIPHAYGTETMPCAPEDDDGNSCTAGLCVDGFCRERPVADGTACPDGACSKGVCCPTGWSTCSGECVDIQTDAAHCGACGNDCPADKVCRDGKCACPAGMPACGDVCIDVLTDEANCGTCGNSCPTDWRCQGGECVCLAGTPGCDETCGNTETDENHCGACGRRCGRGERCCGGRCINPDADERNCGRCGRRCARGQTCCQGRCVNLKTNERDCGRCGRRCRPGERCRRGRCR